jgi:hypothetical protein
MSVKEPVTIATTGTVTSDEYGKKIEHTLRGSFAYICLIAFIAFCWIYVFGLPTEGIEQRADKVWSGILPIISAIITYYFTRRA